MYHCFRLHRGQDLYEAIEAYVNDHHIAAGAVVPRQHPIFNDKVLARRRNRNRQP